MKARANSAQQLTQQFGPSASQPDGRRLTTLQHTGLDLGKWDCQRPDRTLGDITEGACHPAGKVSPNVGWFRWQNLARHPSLMVGPETDRPLLVLIVSPKVHPGERRFSDRARVHFGTMAAMVAAIDPFAATSAIDAELWLVSSLAL
jgi:hypothetical protein